MKMFTVVTLVGLLVAMPAHAEDAPQLPSWARPADHHAVQRGKGALMLTLGAVFLPIGIAMAGTQHLVWSGYNSNCQYDCGESDKVLAGGEERRHHPAGQDLVGGMVSALFTAA